MSVTALLNGTTQPTDAEIDPHMRGNISRTYYFSHAGYVAHGVEVWVKGEDIKVNNVWVAVDVGSQIVNRSGVLNQVQGATLDRLGQALGQEITFVKDRF